MFFATRLEVKDRADPGQAPGREVLIYIISVSGTSSSMAAIPTFAAKFEPLGTGGSISAGGANFAALYSADAASHRSSAETHSYQAGLASRIAGYARRELDWAFQSNQAAGEISLTLKQLRAAQIGRASCRERV